MVRVGVRVMRRRVPRALGKYAPVQRNGQLSKTQLSSARSPPARRCAPGFGEGAAPPSPSAANSVAERRR
eukprot:scaffold84824_cov39-Phaeocystis_antarctica.AAC.1